MLGEMNMQIWPLNINRGMMAAGFSRNKMLVRLYERSRYFRRPLVVSSLIVFFISFNGWAQPRTPQMDSLRSFLQNYLKIKGPRKLVAPYNQTTRYSYSKVDLSNKASDEIIVYVTGRAFCGSGGCDLLILQKNGSSFSVISKSSVAHLPIRVLPSKTNGWHDIGIWVEGGGILPGHVAALKFNGQKYPSNPTTVPTGGSTEAKAGGTIVPLERPGALLYGCEQSE